MKDLVKSKLELVTVISSILVVILLFLMTFCPKFRFFALSLWINGGWLAFSLATLASSLVILLVNENRWCRCLLFFAIVLSGLSIGLIPIESTPYKIQSLIIELLKSHNKGDNSLFSDFGVGLVSLVLTFITGIVLWTVKDAEDGIKKNDERI